ncbi:MAG: response regulator transcription factor [Anaerolineaceae bacterium]
MNLETRVLIVEDNAAVRADLKTLLDLMEGIKVVGFAASGKQAVTLAHTLQPELVILDFELSQEGNGILDGCAAIQAIKSGGSQIKVVVLTAHGYAAARRQALLAGADAFFVKGQDMNPFFQMIKDIHLYRD